MNDDALDAMQAALTALLRRKLPPAETARILASDPAFAAYREWVTGFDLGAIDLMSALAAVWARDDRPT